MFFMYDLGLTQLTGFVIGIAFSWCFDVLIIYAAWRDSRTISASQNFAWICMVMMLLGIGHWYAGYQNLMLIQTLMS